MEIGQDGLTSAQRRDEQILIDHLESIKQLERDLGIDRKAGSLIVFKNKDSID